jgi:hypothetical protein
MHALSHLLFKLLTIRIYETVLSSHGFNFSLPHKIFEIKSKQLKQLRANIFFLHHLIQECIGEWAFNAEPHRARS